MSYEDFVHWRKPNVGHVHVETTLPILPNGQDHNVTTK